MLHRWIPRIKAVSVGEADRDGLYPFKSADGSWRREKKLWYVRYSEISGTVLEKHIHIFENG